jgi:protein transport protein SEC23
MELRQSSSAITYNLPQDITRENSFNFVYVFIVDLYQHSEIDDFSDLIEQLLVALETIPNDIYFTLITFDESVSVFSGTDVVVILPSNISNDMNQLFVADEVSKLLAKFSLKSGGIDSSIFTKLSDETKHQFNTIIKSLKPKVCLSYRSSPRSTGLALYLTSLLLANSSAGAFSKVSLFTSGACSSFPGSIVDQNNHIRTHHDLIQFKTAQHLDSTKFYTALSYIASGLDVEKSWLIANSASIKTTKHNPPQNKPTWTFDTFAGSIEQVGLTEMKMLVQGTMGNFYTYENWQAKLFGKDIINSLEINTINNTLTVATSVNLKVSHLLGGGYSLPSSFALEERGHDAYHENISDHKTRFDPTMSKTNFTNKWKFSQLNLHDTLAVYFQVDTEKSWSELNSKSPKDVHVQFQLTYWDIPAKCWKLKVVTIQKPTTYSLPFSAGKGGNILRENELLKSFNQKAWIVLLARLLVTKLTGDLNHPKTVSELIDDCLTRLLYFFGGVSFKVNNIAEYSHNPYLRLNQIYKINENFHLLPSLVYNLRKNPQLLQIFNSSPDGTTFYHNWFIKSDMKTSLTMIEPQLYKLKDSQSEPIPLDNGCLSLPPQTWLVLDNVFLTVIYLLLDKQMTGKLKLHSSHNEDLLENHEFTEPLTFMKTLTKDRSREGKIIITQTNHSQARYLTSRLNPAENDLTEDFDSMSLKDKTWKWLGGNKKKGHQSLSSDDISLRTYYNDIIESTKNYSP